MQLNVFNTDDHKSGFRLHYLEVYNWGTFDGQVHVIRPSGETSLLTGSNGSGKTTFVDALSTLMVPEKKYRFYNQSSGSEKKGDRTEESYVLGAYSTVNSEVTASAKTLYLRESREHAYSILLAHFANEAGQEATLFQVRYFTGDMKKVYGIAHTALRIEDDFTPFDLGGNWKRSLENKYNKGKGKFIEWFDSAPKYAQRMVEVLGMQSIQALSLFNQTVGIKVLGNLDEFIRTNMLEPRDMEGEFAQLKKHLSLLLDAQRGIEKVEEQIRLLHPLQEHFRAYGEGQQLLLRKKGELETLRIWNSYTRHSLLKAAVEEGAEELNRLQSGLQRVKEEMENLLESERQTKNGLEGNKAGQRLQGLERELLACRSSLRETERQRALFAQWCSELQLEESLPEDDAAYKRVKTEVNRTRLRLEREQRLNEDDDFEARNTKNKADREREEIEAELNGLLQHKNNIPPQLVNLRRELCASLRVDTSELPFAGELMQVRADELHWQPALEKLLHGFALRLLVPDKLYRKVTKYVNGTDLRSRLVYHHVTGNALSPIADPGSVYDKLEFQPGHPLSDWIQDQVILQFGHICVEDASELEHYDRAITLEGLIKNRDRHEKDDRSFRKDPGQYVMGWNNETKKNYLQERRQACVERATKAAETMERCQRKSKKLQNGLMAASHLSGHEGFGKIDTAAVQRTIRTLEEAIRELKESSSGLQVLTDQLSSLREARSRKEAERSSAEKAIALLEAGLQNYSEEYALCSAVVQHIREEEKDYLLEFQQQYAGRLVDVTLEKLSTLYDDLKNELTSGIDTLQATVFREENALNRSIRSLKAPSPELQQRFPDWNGDVHHLPEEAAHAGAYTEWLEKLENDNLPRFKKEFERYLHETVVYKIGELNQDLESWEGKIRDSIQTLNASLGAIQFNRNPDTYIQLGLRPVLDTTIKEFRYRLSDALPQGSDWQQRPFEEKAVHFREKVQPLLRSLEESESYRARVLDVRNWFEFWADEKNRATHEIRKTYRQMGQLSGGEKAQLTYTILCSAIAYQFGITREGKNTRSLRFIAIDESFSNQDEDKATYLMELCRQLHLQLLVVTPSDKIQIVQDYIAHVHLVQRVNGRNSVLYNMTVKELKERLTHALN